MPYFYIELEKGLGLVSATPPDFYFFFLLLILSKNCTPLCLHTVVLNNLIYPLYVHAVVFNK